MAALFNRGLRPGPIAAFKTRLKTYTLGLVLNAALPLGLGPCLKRGLMYRVMATLIKRGYSSNLRPHFKCRLRP